MASVFMGDQSQQAQHPARPQARCRRGTSLLRLADTADVFVHNIRPQKLDKLGLGPDALLTRHQRLIYVGLHGFREDGPYGGRPAYDDIIQGLCGVAGLMDRLTGEPRYAPTIIADKTCGLMATQAILAALYHREKTGRGQYVEIPMFETMVSFLMVEHLLGRTFVPAQGRDSATAACWRRGGGLTAPPTAMSACWPIPTANGGASGGARQAGNDD